MATASYKGASLSMSQKEMLGWLAIGAAALYLAPRIGTFLGKQAVGTVTNIGTGAVIETGKVIGIPETDPTQCQADINAGRTWDASFSCDAKTFLKYVLGQ